MLVLSRRIGEAILIDKRIRVKVLAFGPGKKVRLAIEAPDEVGVWRQELVDRDPELSGNLLEAA